MVEVPIAVGNVPKKNEDLVNVADVFITKWTNNPDMGNSPITLSVFTANVNALQNAITAVEAKTGTIQDRDAAEAIVRQNIKTVLTYVQGLANVNPTRASQIIVNAGFSIKADTGGKGAQEFTATSNITGEVELSAHANKDKYPYQWQFSTDGENWLPLRGSRLSVCTAKNLTSGELFYFRYCIIGENNEYGEYSPSISCRIK